VITIKGASPRKENRAMGASAVDAGGSSYFSKIRLGGKTAMSIGTTDPGGLSEETRKFRRKLIQKKKPGESTGSSNI